MTQVADETTEQDTPPEPDAPPVEPDTPPEGDTPPEPEQPVEPEQPAPPPVDPEAMERIFKKIESRATTYRNAVSDLLGEEAQNLSPCPMCEPGIMGLVYPPEWIQPVNEQHARLLEVLKTPSAPDYQPAPNARRCGTCDGWGQVLSGSRVADKQRVKCPTCQGKGYQGEAEPGMPVQTTNGAVELMPPDDAVALVTDDTDIWGSPKVLDDGQDNPNYGKMPQYKNPSLP